MEQSFHMITGKVCSARVHEYNTTIEILSNVLKFTADNLDPPKVKPYLIAKQRAHAG